MVNKKHYLLLIILRWMRLNSQVSLRKACVGFGLTEKWAEDQIRRKLQNSIGDFVGSDSDSEAFIHSFMKEYCLVKEIDFPNGYTESNLVQEWVDAFGVNLDTDINSIPDFIMEGVDESFEGIKSFAKSALEENALKKDKALTSAVASANMEKSAIDEFMEREGLKKGELEKASVWESGDTTKVALKFSYNKKGGLDKEMANELFQNFSEKLLNHTPYWANRHYPKGASTSSFGVICLHDVHFGKKSTYRVNGEEYNLEIAKERWNTAVRYHVDKLKRAGISKCYFILGNDLYNTDNGKTTTAGTPQDEDTLWENTLDFVQNVVIETAEYLGSNFLTELITVPGNHDTWATKMLGRVLKAYFCNPYAPHPNITVNSDNEEHHMRRYIIYPFITICLTHGDKEKRKNIVNLVNLETEDHSNKSRKEIITGHFHRDGGKEDIEMFGKTAFRVIPSLSGTDRWHNDMGYVGEKASMSFVYSPDGTDIYKHIFETDSKPRSFVRSL